MTHELDAPRALAFAEQALANVAEEYPHGLSHLVLHEGDWDAPRVLHPIFFGSYDWHSSVHMHWLLVRLLRIAPEIAVRAQIGALFNRVWTTAAVAAECAYLDRPGSASFERPYGWGWMLMLSAELTALASSHPDARRWADALEPLAGRFVVRFEAYLPKADYPARVGSHSNTALALLFAYRYALTNSNSRLAALVVDKANALFGNDKNYPAHYEPGPDDFLSAGLIEAALMQEILSREEFRNWWQAFKPDANSLSQWLIPVRVSDRNDPKLAHLDGLNLSRAWCWRLIRAALDGRETSVDRAIDAHLEAALPHATGGAYVGAHWLASFATLALTEPEQISGR